LDKIIIIGPAHPLRGGLATFDERLARQFMEEGHEVVIYTFSLQYPSILFPGKTQYSASPKPEDLNIKVRINSVNPLNWWKVGKEIAAEKPKLVVVRFWLPFMGPCLGAILRIVKKRSNAKIVAITDNIIPHEKRPGDTPFTKYFLGSVDGCVTMSLKVMEDLKTFTKKPAKFVSHPLYDNFGPRLPKQDARKHLGLPTDVYIFLFFGFIRKYKGLDLLIEALDTFLPAQKNAIILVAGEYYAGEDEIKEQISKSAHRASIIEHTHFIKDEEVGLYFSACDSVIQPYKNATQSGVTPLAYHFECPMIVTNVGALPDMVPQGIGLVCEPEPTAIANAMDEMQKFDLDTFERLILVEKAKYAWSTMTSALKNIADE